MKVEILGAEGCQKCSNLRDRVEEIVRDMDISEDVEVVKISDLSELANRGVMSTPALVVDGDLKIKGRVPDEEEIRSILK